MGEPGQEAQTHDYTRPTWGHDYSIRPVAEGLLARMSGWGHGLRNGDYLILRNGDATTRYRIVSVRYYPDPVDMWRALVQFAPRPVVK